MPGKPGRPELELWKPVLMRVASLLINDVRGGGRLENHAHYAVRWKAWKRACENGRLRKRPLKRRSQKFSGRLSIKQPENSFSIS